MTDVSAHSTAVGAEPDETDPALQPPPGYQAPPAPEPATEEPQAADERSDGLPDAEPAEPHREPAGHADGTAEPQAAGELNDDEEAWPTEDATEDPTEEPAKPRTDLEPQIKAVTDDYVTDKLALEDGQRLTPHRIAMEIVGRRIKAGEVADEVSVSAGAVTATLKRWQRYGFAVLVDGPLAFHEYTQDAIDLGLRECKARSRATSKAKRDAAKDAEDAGETIAT